MGKNVYGLAQRERWTGFLGWHSCCARFNLRFEFDACSTFPFRKPHEANPANDRPEERPDTATEREQQALGAGQLDEPADHHIPALIRAHISGIGSSGHVDKLCQRFQDQRAEQSRRSSEHLEDQVNFDDRKEMAEKVKKHAEPENSRGPVIKLDDPLLRG